MLVKSKFKTEVFFLRLQKKTLILFEEPI